MDLSDHVGFSGSRKGMSERQTISVRSLLEPFIPRFGFRKVWFHHGLCIGSDSQSHSIARHLGFLIHGHPPLDNTHTDETFIEDSFDTMDPPYSYHGRNQRIVVASGLLIATPYDNSGRGGTWWTINCARRMGKSRIIVHRDGSMLREEGN